jgi:hypothetical protein
MRDIGIRGAQQPLNERNAVGVALFLVKYSRESHSAHCKLQLWVISVDELEVVDGLQAVVLTFSASEDMSVVQPVDHSDLCDQ